MLLAAGGAGSAWADEVVFRNGDRVTGSATRADGKVTIEGTVFGTVTVSESEVLSITPAATAGKPASAPTTATAIATTQPATPTSAPATAVATAPAPAAKAAPPKLPPPPVKKWSGAVTGSATATRGNSHSDVFRVGFDAARKDDGNILTLNAGYAFGRTENRTTGSASTTTDNWFAQGKYDYSLNERWYNYAMVRVEADYVAELDIRVTPGFGLGYRWINKPEQHFNTEIGVTYVYEKYRNDGEKDHVALRLAYHYDKKLNETVSLVHNLEYLPDVVDIGNFNLNADIGVRAMLTKSMFADLKAEWRHDSMPAPGAEYNDFRYIVGVGWKF